MAQSLQQSFVADPSLSGRLFDLLEIVFPEIELSKLVAMGRALGAPWESASVPFMKFEQDRAIAHVGVLELPLCVMGQPLTVAGIHAVATHPEFRRRGHYRDCMAAALAYCQPRYETLVLTTAQPELYQPFGFRVVPESTFTVAGQGLGQTEGWRLLDLQQQQDCALLHRLLETRIPVSEVVGVYPEKAVFLVNEASRPLHYAEALDALVVTEQQQDCLQLFDVVADHPIAFADILQYVSPSVNQIVFYFSPDRFQVAATAVAHVLDDAYLMVRGPFAAAGQPLMLPRSARC